MKKVEWQAEEYLQQEKKAGWYVGLIIIGLTLVGVSVWLQWWTFTALVVVAVLALIIYSVRPPRQVKYVLDDDGLHEGESRVYKFEDFKAFGLLRDGTHFSIVLTPKKRFSPAVTVFFPEAKGEEIVDVFGAKLPMEEVKADFLDKMVKWLRI